MQDKNHKKDKKIFKTMLDIGNRIKKRLKEKGITQTQLAGMLNVHRKSVGGWVKGTNELFQ